MDCTLNLDRAIIVRRPNHTDQVNLKFSNGTVQAIYGTLSGTWGDACASFEVPYGTGEAALAAIGITQNIELVDVKLQKDQAKAQQTVKHLT